MAHIEQRCKNGKTVRIEVGDRPEFAARRFRQMVEENGGPYVPPVVDRDFGRRAARGLFPEIAEAGKQVDYETFIPGLLSVVHDEERRQAYCAGLPVYWTIERTRAQREAQARKRAG